MRPDDHDRPGHDHLRRCADGALSEVITRFGWERQLHLTLSEPLDDAVVRATAALAGRDGIQPAQPDPSRLQIAFDSRTATSGELIRDLATALPVADIRIEEPTAESIIRQLYEGSLTFEQTMSSPGSPSEA